MKKIGKGMETYKILLEDSLSLWIQVSNNKLLFCVYVNIMKPKILCSGLFMNKLQNLENYFIFIFNMWYQRDVF